MPKIGAIILAAGRSTRFKSALPKVLHPICGRPVVFYPVREVRKTGADPVVVVISRDIKDHPLLTSPIKGEESKKVVFAIQPKQLGTGDAVKAARKALGSRCDYVLIIPGDVPLLRLETLKKLIEETISKSAVCGLITMEMEDPAEYGRVVRNSAGDVTSIVEARDAGPSELLIVEVNSSVYCMKREWLFDALQKISPKNAQKEYYLTDVIKLAADDGLKVIAHCISDHSEPMGINTRKELAEADRLMRRRILDRMMLDGVGIQDELHTYIDDGVLIGLDTTIAPHCFISGSTKIGRNCRIESGAVIKDSLLGDDVVVKPYSVIEESVVRNGAQVGPFARLRPGTVIEASARVGNFVEIKKSLIKKGAKANHLSYIGDAVIGARTNVGCGTITCNYDGRKKHKTVVGDDVFIGSDVQFVAPVKIGRGAVIGAGSTITDDVPAGALAVARGRQVVKKNWKRSG